MRSLTIFLLLLSIVGDAWGAQGRATVYLDGAIVEQELHVKKGYVELPLPATMQEGSLRLKASGKGRIARVEVVKARSDRRRERELARLTEQKGQLRDRLRGLEVKEEIFTASAKSQSSKSPRRTKNNPEPLTALRQGTDYAISQLESVYRSRRRTEAELKEIEERLRALQGDSPAGKARIWITGQKGLLVAAWRDNALKFRPVYEFHLDGGGRVAVDMAAELDGRCDAAQVRGMPHLVADPPQALPPFKPLTLQLHRIRSGSFSLIKESFNPEPLPQLSFVYRNDTSQKLPPGVAVCYRGGAYLGSTTFSGALPGEEHEVVCGR
jgi:hypothetical protein